MINEVKTVRDQCFALTKGSSPTLKDVTNVFKAFTKIDKIQFVRYAVDSSNPIIGQFWKWEQSFAYNPPEICVEIRYADHLENDQYLKRLVICKEICHALDSRKGSHSTKNSTIDNLAASFALQSALQPVSKMSAPFAAEILAEIAAYEILCPSVVRKQMLDSGEYAAIGIAGVSSRYRIPQTDIESLFRPAFLQTTLNMFG